jgi:hypothetical protein
MIQTTRVMRAHSSVTRQALKGNLAVGTTPYVLAPNSDRTPQLRVYGMRYFDDKAPYWGNTTKKIIGAGGDRFTLRSAKFVVDGS